MFLRLENNKDLILQAIREGGESATLAEMLEVPLTMYREFRRKYYTEFRSAVAEREKYRKFYNKVKSPTRPGASVPKAKIYADYLAG